MSEIVYRTRYVLFLTMFLGSLFLLVWMGYGQSGNAQDALSVILWGVPFCFLLVGSGAWGYLALCSSEEVCYLIGPLFKKRRVSISSITSINRSFRVFNYDMEIHYCGREDVLVVNMTIFRDADIAEFIRTLVRLNPTIELDPYFVKMAAQNG